MFEVAELIHRLSDRDARRSEATVQADVRALLLAARLDLEDHEVVEVPLESPVGNGRRIDVERGTTLIEVKRDLRKGRVYDQAVEQLETYVRRRQEEFGCRYAGLVTDGAEWHCFHLQNGHLAKVASHTVRRGRGDPPALLTWLEGVLATTRDVQPTPQAISERLGASSSAYALDRASLAALYVHHENEPSVCVHRRRWAEPLMTALGSQFEDTDDLFVEHTLLVSTAKIIAHAVLGLRVETLSADSLLTGSRLSECELRGVVESDFSDWVLEVPGGEAFLRTLARRLARFDWSHVKHDVLKVLYESVIGAETRRKLGEYYTPDWLAEKMVRHTIQDPLAEKVLDPACGSGTFLFHAVRHYLAAAAGVYNVGRAIQLVTRDVLGMDLHPVAVVFARVTYVLAIGRERLQDPLRGDIQIPVCVGDSMQWRKKRPELWDNEDLVLQVKVPDHSCSIELRFPAVLLDDPNRFDWLVHAMAEHVKRQEPDCEAILSRPEIPVGTRDTLRTTFHNWQRLQACGRNLSADDIRSLIQPRWLAKVRNRVDVLIGNPPWLAYRHMHQELQGRFREMSEARGLWEGARVATHQDLSGLFVARVTQLYLKDGGRFAFVMPNSVLDREQFTGFRKGLYPDPREPVNLSFDTPWDLRRIRPHLFPRGAAVVFGARLGTPKKMPSEVEWWTGPAPAQDATWSEAETQLTRRTRSIQAVEDVSESHYRDRFRQGATVVPRVLFLVEEMPAGPLGMPAGKVKVRSVRSAYEKPPWKDLETLEGVVEEEFVRPLILGANLLPYRTLPPARAVLPVDAGGTLVDQRLARHPKLAEWWHEREALWRQHRSSERLSLVEQLDYHGKLSAQLPIHSLRILYAASGMHLCAAWIESSALVEHSAYWAPVQSREEARYLCAILNAAATTELVRPYMSYGKDERHIDKHVWRLPIPAFDREDDLQAEIAHRARAVEARVRSLPLDETRSFISLRRRIRNFLAEDPTAQRIEELVVELLELA